MRAVATTVMNRVRVSNGEYQRVCEGDLRRVFMQMCQFCVIKPPSAGWKIRRMYGPLRRRTSIYQVADWAINGGIYTGVGSNCLWYMNPFVPQCPDFFPYNKTGYWFTRLRQHCFYNPTEAYAQT
jgi:N-acetylmuramoyl-L-alanine amidase